MWGKQLEKKEKEKGASAMFCCLFGVIKITVNKRVKSSIVLSLLRRTQFPPKSQHLPIFSYYNSQRERERERIVREITITIEIALQNLRFCKFLTRFQLIFFFLFVLIGIQFLIDPLIFCCLFKIWIVRILLAWLKVL